MKRILAIALILLAATAHAAFDGSGTFNRLYNWEADRAANIKIQASRMDAEMDGFATGLSTCVLKDGTQTITANIPFNSKRITGLGSATASTDAPTAAQVRDGTLCTGTAAGSSNAYTFTRTVAGSTYVTGTVVWMVAPFANTASATLNLDGMGAKEIKKAGSTALSSGDVVSGTTYPFYFDGTYWQAPTITSAAASVTPTQIISNTTSVSAISGTTGVDTSRVSITVANQNVAWATSQTFNVSGTLNINGSPLVSGMTLISTGTITNGIPQVSLTNLTGYTVYKVFATLDPSASSTSTSSFSVKVSTNNGTSYLGTSIYEYSRSALFGSTVTGAAGTTTTCDIINDMSVRSSSGVSPGGDVEITLTNMGSSARKVMHVRGGYYKSASGYSYFNAACNINTGSVVNAIRLDFDTASQITTTYSVYGLK